MKRRNLHRSRISKARLEEMIEEAYATHLVWPDKGRFIRGSEGDEGMTAWKVDLDELSVALRKMSRERWAT